MGKLSSPLTLTHLKILQVGGVGGGLLVEWDTYQVNDKGQAHRIVLDKQGSDVR